MREGAPSSARAGVRRLFFSPDEPRLRAGWRLAVQMGAFVAILILLVVPCVVLAAVLSPDTLQSQILWIAAFLQAVAVLASVYLCRRYVDRRSFASLGLERPGRGLGQVAAGAAISAIMMGLVFGSEYAAGWLQLTGVQAQLDSPIGTLARGAAWLTIFVLVGFSEEIWFRGYQLQTIASGINLPWAVLLSSGAFGMLHLSNPNSGAWGLVLAGIALAGLLMAYAYVRTRQLWLPIGLHIGWNFFEGVVFGLPVSGLKTDSLLQVSMTGPAVWTGGAFGPEAGLVLVPALVVGFLLVHLLSRPARRSSRGN